MADKHLVNGVDVSGLSETVQSLKDDPELAKCRFYARGTWLGGARNRTAVKDFFGAGERQVRSKPFVFDKDEPAVLGGEDQAANPVEYLLTGLAGCLTTTLVYHAAAQGIELHRVETELEGDLDLQGLFALRDDVHPGYHGIRVKFKIDSEATEEQLQELIEYAKGHSPVCASVTGAVPVEVKLAREAVGAAV